MKMNKTLLFALASSVLIGNAGYAVDNSSCKMLQVKKKSTYALDVIYKDCLTGKVETQRMALAEDTRNFFLDPSLKSGEELKINGVAILTNPLWKSATVGSGWTVICDGSIAHPECRGTPMEPDKNCKTLKVSNTGGFIAQVEFTECVSTAPRNPQLWRGDSDTYSVEPGTNARVIVGGTGQKLWPADSNATKPIGEGYNITCGGALGSTASCTESPLKK